MSWKALFTVFKREFRSYFYSPMAYIIMSLFLIFTGWFFFRTFFLADRADLRGFFGLLPIVFAFVVPASSMRLFADEYRSGSFEILGTLPISDWDIVLGKFLFLFTFLVLALVPTISYPLCVAAVGELDWGPVWGGYIGALFMGSLFAAVGLLGSSLTRNQIVALIVSLMFCMFFILIDKMLILLPAAMTPVLQFLSADYHFTNIARGVIDSRDLLYFVSVAFIALYATGIAVKERR